MKYFYLEGEMLLADMDANLGRLMKRKKCSKKSKKRIVLNGRELSFVIIKNLKSEEKDKGIDLLSKLCKVPPILLVIMFNLL
jgi:hypothetical protein